MSPWIWVVSLDYRSAKLGCREVKSGGHGQRTSSNDMPVKARKPFAPIMFPGILIFRLNIPTQSEQFREHGITNHHLSNVFYSSATALTFSGKLENVEPITMNLSLSEVTFIGTDEVTIDFDSFYVQGKNIRYVQIPDEVDMLATIKRWGISAIFVSSKSLSVEPYKLMSQRWMNM